MDGYVNLDHVVRAWIMVQAGDNASGIAQEIYAYNEQLTWPRQHVVRADMVEGARDFNIIASVWADDKGVIEKLAAAIRDWGAEAWIAWAVQGPEGQHPYPPHKAWGLVPGAEANPVARPMGFNAWG
jgi:hypothetical protein